MNFVYDNWPLMTSSSWLLEDTTSLMAHRVKGRKIEVLDNLFIYLFKFINQTKTYTHSERTKTGRK